MGDKLDIETSHKAQSCRKYKTLFVSDASSTEATSVVASFRKYGYPVVAEISKNKFQTDYLAEEATLDAPEVVCVIEPQPCATLFERLQAFQKKIPCAILMFSEDSSSETIGKAAKYGVQAYLTEIPSEHRIESVIDAAMARFKVFDGVNRELNTMKQSLKERKVVERAKGILMHRKSLDEATAYRAMQKMAMNRNVKLVELAQSMISASEILD